MRLPDFQPTGPLTIMGSWVRAVRAILTNGWTVAEHSSGDLKTVRWVGDELLIATRCTTRPLSVLAVAVMSIATPGPVASGGVVTWEWVGDANRSIRVSSIGSVGAGEYDVTLWIVGG
jgi:hypothetical protein